MILKFEHSSKDGSFFIAANYDGNTIYMEDTLNRSSTHTSPENQRDLRSHQATAGAAAALAHAYIVYKDIPVFADFAEECLAAAIRAWNWATDPANPQNRRIDAANRVYEFNQEDAVKASGGNPAVYGTYIQNNYTNANVVRCFDPWQSLNFNHGGKSFLGFIHYLYGNNDANTAVRNRFTSSSNGFPNWRNTILTHNIWGTSYPTWGYWWGSNQMIAQNSMTLTLGSIVLGDIPANIISNMENTAHHLLGINPISFSYVSGHGENSVMNIYSGIFSQDKRLTPYKIPPGYFTEGTNHYDNRHLSKFDGKCYIDSDGEWTTNENTLYGNAAMVFLTASVMAKLTPPSSGCNPAMGNHLVVPASVKHMAKDAFKGCSITEVTFMGNLPTFGADALPFNNIAKLNFAKDNLTLPAESLKNFTFVEMLTFTGDNLRIENGNAGKNIFDGSAAAPTTALKTVTFKDDAIIGNLAFSHCPNLETVIGSPANIGGYAFANTSKLIEFDFSGTTNIGNSAFSGSGLSGDIDLATVSSIGVSAFAGIKITGVTFGSDLTSIPAQAFSSCTDLKEAYIPPSVTTINASAFEGVGTAESPLLVYGEVGSAAQQYAVANHPRIIFVDPTSVLSPDHITPNLPDNKEKFAPDAVLAGGFTAGPNPVSKRSGEVNFFWQGKRIQSSALTIFDASGNVINRVKIKDGKSIDDNSDRRTVGVWDWI
jgi:hypothetical protein